VLDGVVAATFEDIQRSGDVALPVGMGALTSNACARLRGEMHHPLKLLACEQLRDAVVVR
jgi:hypothetical protein